MFEHQYCRGKSAAFEAPEAIGTKAAYSKTDMEARGFGYDNASSLMIPYGYAVTLYDGAGFTGDSYTVQGPIYLDSTMRHACVSLHDKFEDKAASLEVFKTGTQGAA